MEDLENLTVEERISHLEYLIERLQERILDLEEDVFGNN